MTVGLSKNIVVGTLPQISVDHLVLLPQLEVSEQEIVGSI